MNANKRRGRYPKLEDAVIWMVMLFAMAAGACGASVLWAVFIAWRKGVGA